MTVYVRALLRAGVISITLAFPHSYLELRAHKFLSDNDELRRRFLARHIPATTKIIRMGKLKNMISCFRCPLAQDERPVACLVVMMGLQNSTAQMLRIKLQVVYNDATAYAELCKVMLGNVD